MGEHMNSKGGNAPFSCHIELKTMWFSDKPSNRDRVPRWIHRLASSSGLF